MKELFTLERVIIVILSFLLGIGTHIFITKEWNLSTGSTVTVIVAAAAFFSSYYHFHSMRKHQRLSVKPKFQLSNRFDSTENEGFYTFRITLENVGLGPGEVTSKTMELGGTKTTNVINEFEEWTALVNEVLPNGCNPECHTARCDTNFSINVGKTLELLLVKFDKKSMSFMDARDMIILLNKEIKISISYSSIYGTNFQCENHLTTRPEVDD